MSRPCLAGNSSDSQLLSIQRQWAHINYELEGDSKADAFKALIVEAEALVKAAPENAANHIWLGIVQSSTAGAEGGLGALKYAKAARKNLEQALRLDETALQGSALTSLGVLYHKVPGWPIGFGSDKKAQQLLAKALEINPGGLDPNYFYAEYLFDNGKYAEARNYLLIAQNAQPRPDRPLADSGRQQEVALLWQKLESK
ncbi:tetratricopeptide repeat protein [Alteromonas aestuariivivens]